MDIDSGVLQRIDGIRRPSHSSITVIISMATNSGVNSIYFKHTMMGGRDISRMGSVCLDVDPNCSLFVQWYILLPAFPHWYNFTHCPPPSVLFVYSVAHYSLISALAEFCTSPTLVLQSFAQLPVLPTPCTGLQTLYILSFPLLHSFAHYPLRPSIGLHTTLSLTLLHRCAHYLLPFTLAVLHTIPPLLMNSLAHQSSTHPLS